MSFSLLFFTGRISLLYARTLINSSYRRFASGLASVTIYVNERGETKLARDLILAGDESPVDIEYEQDENTRLHASSRISLVVGLIGSNHSSRKKKRERVLEIDLKQFESFLSLDSIEYSPHFSA